MNITKDMIGKKILYEIDDTEYLLAKGNVIHEGLVTGISEDGKFVRIYTILPLDKRGEAWHEIKKIELLSLVEVEEEVEDEIMSL